VKQPAKYVFVTGGVLSGLGKGIAASSIGKLLKARDLNVNIQKCDPYLNVDAGLLNPGEHGECFVTKDGAETDLDLGHYERFLDQELTQSSSLMSGTVLYKVIKDERAGRYQGSTVQIIPHVTAAIKDKIQAASKGFDVHIVEIGGTVGDYESLSFLEAIRELSMHVGQENYVFVHVVYMPYLGASQEFKTKPAQNSVRELRGLGIVPDILIARSENKMPKAIINKLSLFSGVAPEGIVLLPNASSIYEVPLTLETAGITKAILNKFKIKTRQGPAIKKWAEMVRKAEKNYPKTVTVAMVAKYLTNQDTYLSVTEALKSAAWNAGVKLKIKWVDASKLEDMDQNKLAKALKCDGMVVPGGFGNRGVEGMIKATQYSMDNNVPYLGLCLGLQVAVIAAARRAGIKDANSTEFDSNTKNPVINTINDQKGKENTGGTMRLGDYRCNIKFNSMTHKVYGTLKIVERHRHRYECNNKYLNDYERWGITASGINPDNHLIEMIEGVNHPFLLASQFHPEFKSRPNRPRPMFSGFIKACSSRT
jgi:CTP synthase